MQRVTKEHRKLLERITAQRRVIESTTNKLSKQQVILEGLLSRQREIEAEDPKICGAPTTFIYRTTGKPVYCSRAGLNKYNGRCNIHRGVNEIQDNRD